MSRPNTYTKNIGPPHFYEDYKYSDSPNSKYYLPYEKWREVYEAYVDAMQDYLTEGEIYNLKHCLGYLRVHRFEPDGFKMKWHRKDARFQFKWHWRACQSRPLAQVMTKKLKDPAHYYKLHDIYARTPFR